MCVCGEGVSYSEGERDGLTVEISQVHVPGRSHDNHMISVTR